MDKTVLRKQNNVSAFKWQKGQVSVMKYQKRKFSLAVLVCIMLVGILFVGGTTTASASTTV